jgi:large subunit ribosomal protein L7A
MKGGSPEGDPVTELEALGRAESRAVGANQTTKAIRKGRAQVVFVARDADRRVVEPVLRAAQEMGVPVVEVASGRELGRACGIAVGASAAAILKRDR